MAVDIGSIVTFLEQLHDNNNREWFHENKPQWAYVKKEFEALTADVLQGVASFDSSVRGVSVRDCTFRIARDTRFSHNKNPYKSHLGAHIVPRGKLSGYAGYYFHIEPKGDSMLGFSFLSAGLHNPEALVLRSVREDILDNGEEFTRKIEAASGYTLWDSETLKRTPVGFPKDTPYDALLRRKDYSLVKQIDRDFIFADNLAQRIVEGLRPTCDFVTQLNRAVQYAYEEMS